jgi:fatty acid-binding protein DegV
LVVPDPKYLVAGGRVSNFKGAILKLFKLKLVLSLSANALKYYDKVVKLEKIPEVLIKGAKELAPSFSFEKIKRECILYSPQITDPEFDIEKIKNIVVKGFCGQVPNVTPEYDQLTPIIAVHTGPNYFVIGFELK